jgi:hypothetical protein
VSSLSALSTYLTSQRWGSRGGWSWNEVEMVQSLLAWPAFNCGGCWLLRHPVWLACLCLLNLLFC